MKLNFKKFKILKKLSSFILLFSFSPHKSQGDNKKGATTDAS